jgi:uncharacterized protein YqgC (DUF456 family)
MDLFFAIIGTLLLLSGFAGSILPGLPGPPLAWAAVLLLHFTSYATYSTVLLISTGIVMIAITLLDYYIPIWGTKKFGGTRAGVIGSTVGLIAGMFIFPPFGVIVGPFVGAFIGEILVDKNDLNKALKSAIGSFLGFVAGTLLKLAYCGYIAFLFFRDLFMA